VADSGPAEMVAQEAEAVDLDPVAVAVQEEVVADLGQVVQEKCIKRPVQIVVMKLKCHLYHPVTGQYTAGNATRNTGLQKDTKQIYFQANYI